MRAHLASLVEDFRKNATEIAVVDHRGNRRYRTTYGELAQIAGRFSAELEARGIAAGERVVLWGANSAEWMGAFFGCLLRGVVAVPLDAAGPAEFESRVVADVSPRLIVGDARLLAGLTADVATIAFNAFHESLPAKPQFAVSRLVGLDAPFQIVFTSGTTSEPRGIVHTHRNILASLTPIESEIHKYRKYERIFHPLRFLHSLPLSHVFGQFMGLWVPPLLAAEVHFDTQLEPAKILSITRSERISVLVAVPRVLELLRAHLLSRFPLLASDLAAARRFPVWKRWWKLRAIHSAFGFKFWALICGGASLPAELEEFWHTLGFALIQGYGMTETAALVTLNHPFKIGRGTIGQPLPGREVRIGDDGEILVRGDMLSNTTWQQGKLRHRETEWLATGDLARQDASGELRFLGRKGDLIVTAAGMNIHPTDLESAMMEQPGVRGCVVVPCATPAGIEPVAAVLFAGDDAALKAATIDANRKLASYQQIRRAIRWPELNFPYTPTGKLLRRKVADWACAEIADQTSAQAGQASDTLLQLIAGITHESPAHATNESRLSEDLHLDSLGRVHLQSLLGQRLGVELSDDAFATIETLGQLRRLTETAVSAGTPLSAETPLQPQTHSPESAGHVYPRWPWAWPILALRIVFLEAVLRPLIWLLAAPRVVHASASVPSAPLLLIANHVTAYDGALVLYALPTKLRRRVAIAMSGEMLLDFRKGRNQGNPVRNALAPLAYLFMTALFNVFPLPRRSGFRGSFAHAGAAMDMGYSVLIFPEGHRSSDGTLQSFRPGIGILAKESNVAILPVALKGLGEMKRSGWFRSGKLEIRVGSAVPVGDGADASEIARTLEAAMRALQATGLQALQVTSQRP